MIHGSSYKHSWVFVHLGKDEVMWEWGLPLQSYAQANIHHCYLHSCKQTHYVVHVLYLVASQWLSGKKSICQCRRHGFNPWEWKITWRRKWQPTRVFLPGKFHGQRSLAGFSPKRCKESDTTEQLSMHTHVCETVSLFIFYLSIYPTHTCTHFLSGVAFFLS